MTADVGSGRSAYGIPDIYAAVDEAIETGAQTVAIETNDGGHHAALFAEYLLRLRGRSDITVTRTIRVATSR